MSDEKTASATVPLEALCVLIEHAIRGGLYMGHPLFDAWEAMPTEVHDRLGERQKVHTERLLAANAASVAHHSGEPHDESICVPCALLKADERAANNGGSSAQ